MESPMPRFCLLCLLLLPACLQAAPLQLQEDTFVGVPWQVNRSDSGGFSDVRGSADEHWQQMPVTNAQIGQIKGEIWLRQVIVNPTDHEEWLLEFSNRAIQWLDVYIIRQNGEIQLLHMGGMLPAAQTQALPTYRINIPLQLSKDEQVSLWLRVSHNGFLDVNAHIAPHQMVLLADLRQTSLEMLLYGLFIGLLIYHLIIFAGTRESIYLYYSLFISSLILLFSFGEGYLLAVFSNKPEMAYYFGQCSMPLISLAAIQLSRGYLSLAEHLPRIDKLAKILMVLALLTFMIRASGFMTFVIPMPAVIATFTFAAIPLISVWLHHRHDNPLGKVFARAWGLWGIVAVYVGLVALNIVQGEVGQLWFYLKIAFAAQAVLLAWTLAQRIRLIKYAMTKAETENRAKNDLIARVSHEIRTPMNGILGTSQLLESHLHDPEAQQLNQTIYQSGLALVGVINDLIDSTKLDMGRIALNPVPTDIRKMARQINTLLSAQFQAKQLTMLIDIAADVPAWMLVDETRLRQVLLNLIGNAVKFTESGSVTLAVKYNGQLTVSVSDTGRGIAPEDLKRIMRPFEQIITNRHDKRAGTGLGLHISKKLVDLMGGELQVHSVLQQGTCFSFSLPVEIMSAEEVSAGHAGEELPPLNILIADDNAVNLKVLGGLLKKMGHHYWVANNGQEAVGLFTHHMSRIDVVLLDCEMPVMDGYSAARHMRELEASQHLPALPIIAVTAHAYDQHLEQVKNAGMDDQLSKPITLSSLENKLREHYRRR